jgi:hypothetical protein
MTFFNIFNKHRQKTKTEPRPPSPILPNLLMLGFPKCGTHGLLHNLGHHPDIHTHPNEVGFFGKNKMSREEYMSLFRSDKKYNGEKSPYYVLQEKAMKEISELIPEAKLFVCIRHPVQMVHSFYNFRIFEFKHGYPAGIDPEKYRFEDIVLKNIEINGFSINHGRYIDHIKNNVLKYFPVDQIYFVIQEQMMANMNVEMNKIFAHLSLPPCKSEFVTKIKLHNEQFRYDTINYL